MGLKTGSDFTVMTDISAMNAFLVLIFGIRFYKHVIMLYMYAKFYTAGSFKFIITFWWVVVERLNLVITYYSILSNETLYYDRAYTVSAISGMVGHRAGWAEGWVTLP